MQLMLISLFVAAGSLLLQKFQQCRFYAFVEIFSCDISISQFLKGFLPCLHSQITRKWLTCVYTGSARDSGYMTTQHWWLHWKTVKSFTLCSSWTLTFTTPRLASTARGSSLGHSKTWTAASGNSTPGKNIDITFKETSFKHFWLTFTTVLL